jgi:endogenous inhibitor of DNA gyrase (YacG/DUF329 family)
MVPCPICHGATLPRAQNKAAPFCSPRCKLVDLGRWLDERYRVETPDRPDAEAGSPSEEGA